MLNKATILLPEGSVVGLCSTERRGLGQRPIKNVKVGVADVK